MYHHYDIQQPTIYEPLDRSSNFCRVMEEMENTKSTILIMPFLSSGICLWPIWYLIAYPVLNGQIAAASNLDFYLACFGTVAIGICHVWITLFLGYFFAAGKATKKVNKKYTNRIFSYF